MCRKSTFFCSQILFFYIFLATHRSEMWTHMICPTHHILYAREIVVKEINAEEKYLIMVTKNVVLCLHPDPNSFSMLSPCLSLSRTLSYQMTSCFETAPF